MAHFCSFPAKVQTWRRFSNGRERCVFAFATAIMNVFIRKSCAIRAGGAHISKACTKLWARPCPERKPPLPHLPRPQSPSQRTMPHHACAGHLLRLLAAAAAAVTACSRGSAASARPPRPGSAFRPHAHPAGPTARPVPMHRAEPVRAEPGPNRPGSADEGGRVLAEAGVGRQARVGGGRLRPPRLRREVRVLRPPRPVPAAARPGPGPGSVTTRADAAGRAAPSPAAAAAAGQTVLCLREGRRDGRERRVVWVGGCGDAGVHGTCQG